MSQWNVVVSRSADKDFSKIPKEIKSRIFKVLVSMEDDPFNGDVKRIQSGHWRELYRRRVGRYRIIFRADYNQNHEDVEAILLRNEKTYR